MNAAMLLGLFMLCAWALWDELRRYGDTGHDRWED